MPCRDYYDDNPAAYYGPKLADKDAEIAKLRKQISFAESALCQTLAALDDLFEDAQCRGEFYDTIDFAAAGITKAELVKWHTRHKELDAKHRADELRRKAAAEAKQKAAEKVKQERADARAKLTPAERKLLGVR